MRYAVSVLVTFKSCNNKLCKYQILTWKIFKWPNFSDLARVQSSLQRIWNSTKQRKNVFVYIRIKRNWSHFPDLKGGRTRQSREQSPSSDLNLDPRLWTNGLPSGQIAASQQNAMSQNNSVLIANFSQEMSASQTYIFTIGFSAQVVFSSLPWWFGRFLPNEMGEINFAAGFVNVLCWCLFKLWGLGPCSCVCYGARNAPEMCYAFQIHNSSGLCVPSVLEEHVAPLSSKQTVCSISTCQYTVRVRKMETRTTPCGAPFGPSTTSTRMGAKIIPSHPCDPCGLGIAHTSPNASQATWNLRGTHVQETPGSPENPPAIPHSSRRCIPDITSQPL